MRIRGTFHKIGILTLVIFAPGSDLLSTEARGILNIALLTILHIAVNFIYLFIVSRMHHGSIRKGQ